MWRLLLLIDGLVKPGMPFDKDIPMAGLARRVGR
jgi:hypothetical protein